MEGNKGSSIDLIGLIFVVSVLLILHAIQKWTGIPVLHWLEKAVGVAFGWTLEAAAWILEKTFNFLKWLL